MVECLSNKHMALDLVLSSEDKKGQNKKKLHYQKRNKKFPGRLRFSEFV